MEARAMSDTIFVRTTNLSVSETVGSVRVEIARVGPDIGDITVEYGIVGDTATDGLDFIGGYGTVVILDGEDRAFVDIPILDDALGEATEALSFSIIDISDGNLTAPRTLRIGILDDELPLPPPPTEPPLIPEYTVTEEVIGPSLGASIRLEFSPIDDSLAYVADKRGRISYVDVDTGERKVMLDLVDSVNSLGDRGLLDIAVHPDFANNPYIYVFACIDPPDAAAETGFAGLDGRGNRFAQVLRFTADAATGYKTIVADSKVVMLGANAQSLADISGGGQFDYTKPEYSGAIASEQYVNPDAVDRTVVINGFKQDYLRGDSSSHYGGALTFGPDGALYVNTGDGTSFNYADPRTPQVQSLDSLSGKVLRIDPLTGLGLQDNPFVEDGVDLTSNRAKVYQLGLRNPYALTFDADGRTVGSNTGWFTYEDIFSGGPGANFGWPFYEGSINGVPQKAPDYRDFPEAQAFYAKVESGEIVITPSLVSLNHDPGAPGYTAQALIGGDAIYRGDLYPELDGYYLFFEFKDSLLFAIDTEGSGDLKFLGRISPGATHITEGPDGELYFVNLFEGTVGRFVLNPIVITGLVLDGTTGKNTLDGAAGDDTITGFAGDDVIRGFGGNDLFIATIGDFKDSYDGGTGIDTLDLSLTTAPIVARLDLGFVTGPQTKKDTVISVENIVGTNAADRFFGNDAANTFTGGRGSDTLVGGGGDDVFVYAAGDGFDVIKDFGDVAGNQDVIDLSAFGFADAATALSYAKQVANGVRIDFGGGDYMILRGVSLAQFDAGDILI